MNGFHMLRLLLLPIFLIAGVYMMDEGRKRNIPAWASWTAWLLVTVMMWFAFGLLAGDYA